jgi:VCBS repeat-containing protein
VMVDPANPGDPLNPIPAADPMNIIPDVTTVDSATPPSINVADFVRDPEGDPLVFAATCLPPGITIDPATGVMSGTLPADASQGGPNGDGVYIVTITATDPGGLVTTTTVTYTVGNPPPVAVDDMGTLGENAVSTGNVLVNDSDPDGDSLSVVSATYMGQPITIGVPFTLPNGAVLTLNPDGSYVFDPKTAYDGLDVGESVLEAIQYTISDGEGGLATATLNLTITGENDAPRLVDPNDPGNINPSAASVLPPARAPDASGVTIPTAQVFLDPDDEPLAFSATGLPPGLVIDPVTGVISGTLSPDASLGGLNGDGVYPITVTVTDPDGTSRSVNFLFTATNPPPVAVDNTAQALPNLPLELSVLPNDNDPDGDTLTVVSAESENGQVTILPDGRVRFIPARGFVGQAVITYTISDGQGGFSTARVLVNVLPEDSHVAPANPAPWSDADRKSGLPIDLSSGGLSVLMAASGGDRISGIGERGAADDRFSRFLDTRTFRDLLAGDTLGNRSFLGMSDGLMLGEVDGGRKLWVETMRHDGNFVLKVYEKTAGGKVSMVDYTLRSGEDLRWLNRFGKDIHMGLPPAHQDSVEVEIEAVLSTGEVVRRKVILDAVLGQVRAVQEGAQAPARSDVLMKLY